MSEREQIAYLASWLHSYRCGRTLTLRERGVITPDHSWTTCTRMRRFWWAARQPSDQGPAEGGEG